MSDTRKNTQSPLIHLLAKGTRQAASRPSLLRCAARVVARNMVLWVSFVPAHGNLAKGTCILDIRWLLLMETLSPCGHSFHLSKGRWSFHSEKSWHQFLLNNCMLQAGSGTAPGNGVAGIAKQRPANRGEANHSWWRVPVRLEES